MTALGPTQITDAHHKHGINEADYGLSSSWACLCAAGPDLLMQLVRDIRHDIAVVNVISVGEPKALLVGGSVASKPVLGVGNGEGRLCNTRATLAFSSAHMHQSQSRLSLKHTLAPPFAAFSALNFTDVPFLWAATKALYSSGVSLKDTAKGCLGCRSTL